MNWKRMLAYVTSSVDEELLARNEYLVTENRILRNQVKGRIRLTDPQRISLAKIAKRLGRKALGEIAQIVRPETILAYCPKTRTRVMICNSGVRCDWPFPKTSLLQNDAEGSL